METTNTAFKVVKTNKSGLESTNITNGAVYFVSDTKQLYFDYGSVRTCIEDIVVLDTDAERQSVLFTPLNKFYYIVDVNRLYLYRNGTWLPVLTEIPTASNSTLGGIKVGANLTITNGVLSADNQVMVDNSTIELNQSGNLHVLGVTNTNNGSTIKYWVGSKAEYDAIAIKQDDTIYYIDDGESVTPTIIIDSEISSTSENPVQNKVIYTALSSKANTTDIHDATITIQKNGTNVNTFTLNQGTNKTINISVPVVTDTYNGTSSNGMSGKAVKSAIDSAISSVYKPAGSIAFASLPTLGVSVLGNVYNITDDFTTTADFVEGAGKSFKAGTNIVVVNIGTSQSPVYKFDVLPGMIDLSGYQLANTAVTHTESTSVGNGNTPIYIAADGTATALNFTIAKSVPANAEFTDTTYSVFTGADGTNAGTAGLVKAPGATDNTKFLKGDGTWAVVSTTDTKNTAGATDTAAKIYLIGATAQDVNPRTYSQDTAFVDTYGQLNSSNPGASENSTVVATTKWVTDKGYTTNTGTITGITMNGSSKGTSGVVDLGTVITEIKQDGVGGSIVSRYASCTEAANTSAKTATISNGTFYLESGSEVTVKFVSVNTADNPTLNINSTGAKNIFINGTQIRNGSNKYLLAGVCKFVYDGTQYNLISNEAVDDSTLQINASGQLHVLGVANANDGSLLRQWTGTKAQYDAIQTKSSNVIYYITDSSGGVTPAITIDNALSTTSENPVQNRIITNAINALSAVTIRTWSTT